METLRDASTAARSPRQMRVCHLMSADLWAGAEVQVRTMTSHLRGCREVQLKVVLLNDGRLARELRLLGIDTVALDERRESSWQLVRRVTSILRANRVDILHTHRYKDTVLGALAAKLAGVPHLVRTMHGMPEPMRGWAGVKFGAYDVFDRAALWCAADRIVAVSREMAETLRRRGYRRSAIVAIHNGLDLAAVRSTCRPEAVRRALGVPPHTLLIGTIGRLCAVKGQDILLRAAARIVQRYPDTRVVIAGTGPLQHDLRSLAGTLGLDQRVLFPGAIDQPYDLLSALDIFVLPSLHEGIPMALLEAMAMGKPVVATAVGGVPEVVTNGVDGLLVQARDDRALAEACLQLATDPKRAAVLGAAGRQTIGERFSHQPSGDRLLGIYSSIMETQTVQVPTSASDLSATALSSQLVRGLFRIAHRHGSRAIAESVERWRMRQIRRHPERLTRVLREAKTILVVCQGNIIRSPFAAALVARGVGETAVVRIASGGLAAVHGNPPHPIALQLATARSVDLSRHAASLVAPDIVRSSDLIFVMDVPQLLTMRKQFPEARTKTFLLACLAVDVPLEIRDPVDGDESCFRACFDHISRAVLPIVHTLGGMVMSQ
jgi:glycosyltransferase involved in cell wall biosynthesis/protein-tyrosine-phosphatase